MERLLRETGVGVGVLIAANTLRLIYAPRGETAGWMSWPLASLGRVEGRPMLAGLKLCLGRNAFVTGAPETRLRALLHASREAQNEVSEKLSGQVLGALHELLRGLHRAAPERIEALAERDPHHLYEGLLSCLLRLVFLLYAEDRDLLPTSPEPKLRQLWESGYSVKTLYARLLTDEALNPDTMDERRGGWGQLLAVFRLIHDGYPDWIARRGGKLFDPDAFPFLEGREKGSARTEARVLPVSDGTMLRILHGLMTVEGRAASGAKIRERLSYRSLDVESIGSVYETVMGFTAARASERMIALRDEKKLPTFVGLETLLAQKPADRQKWLKDRSVKLSAKQAKGVKEAPDASALVEAFGSLVDNRASPDAAPIGAGAPYLQPTEERRRSGSHYTPRSLTEPIVRHALEPAFARIGEKASPEAVLALKVCDPACGSGAFLVETCRQLGARLEQAWVLHPTLKPYISVKEDEAVVARRFVVRNCIFGVDKNPAALELAKLALWLVTLAHDSDFTFLDDALKGADSLTGLDSAIENNVRLGSHDVGLMLPQILSVSWSATTQPLPLLRIILKQRWEYVRQLHHRIESMDPRKSANDFKLIDNELRSATAYFRNLGDCTVAAFFVGKSTKERERLRRMVEGWALAPGDTADDEMRQFADKFRSEHPHLVPFHWGLEFVRVFDRPGSGFDVIVGNPPFAGKNTIIRSTRAGYLDWLKHIHPDAHGNADLVAHFFRRSFNLLKYAGAFGLIATNTIAQGDTRATGLAAIIRQGGIIYRVTKRYQWPNEGAAVVVSIVHVQKGGEPCPPVLDGRRVNRVSAYLVAGDFDDAPARLEANGSKAFIGSFLLGMGFTFDDVAAAKGEAESLADMERLIAKDGRNAERLKPFLGGEEVNNSPTHAHHRYAIDFEDFPLRRDPEAIHPWRKLTEETQRAKLRSGVVSADYPSHVAADWPDLLEIVERRVKPQRDPQTRDALRERWWQYAEKRPGLKRATSYITNVLTIPCGATPHLGFSRTSGGLIWSHLLTVFAYPNLAPLAVLQSRIHETWARFFSSSMKDDLRYAPSDCFETFPFPPSYETDPALEAAGQTYHDHRAALMVAADEGMTKTYNRFHKADERSEPIRTLRELHDAMDRAVLHAYGWDDLAAELKPEFLTEETEDDHTYQNRYFWNAEGRDRVLSRLLALNAERHAEEVAKGTAPSRSGSARSGTEEDAD